MKINSGTHTHSRLSQKLQGAFSTNDTGGQDILLIKSKSKYGEIWLNSQKLKITNAKGPHVAPEPQVAARCHKKN